MERAPLEIYTNRSGEPLAAKICEFLTRQQKREVSLKRILVRDKIEQFACGEFKITLESSVRGKDVFLIQCPIDPSTPARTIQDNIWETMQALECLRFCHAQHVTLVMPCLPYSRQDKRAGRESCSALLLAKIIASAGAEALITIDLHANQIKGFYEALDLKPDALYATNIFIDYLKQANNLQNLVILAPDEGSAKRARLFALKLFEGTTDKIEEKLVYTIKQRKLDQASTIQQVTILGDVSGKDVLIADDIFDTAGTVERAARAAKENGARSVTLCGPHALLSHPAAERLDRLYKEGILKELLTTDSVPQAADYSKRHPWYRQFSVAPMLARMIDQVNKEGETSSLYN